RPLVIGDRFDTDIEGAVRAGYDSLFVLTGVGTAADLLTVAPDVRPRYVTDSATDLVAPYPEIEFADGRARCREWVAAVDGEVLRLGGAGELIDALRALCAAAWRGAYPLELNVTADGADAAGALQALGLWDR
ncbi:MAG: HAD hydrolase-like protein, partial [Dehalococcoidia bacterium]